MLGKWNCMDQKSAEMNLIAERHVQSLIYTNSSVVRNVLFDTMLQVLIVLPSLAQPDWAAFFVMEGSSALITAVSFRKENHSDRRLFSFPQKGGRGSARALRKQ